MHYLVTGGAGFIGSHTVERLLAAGHRVRVLDDFSTGARRNLEVVAGNDRLDVLEGDVRDAALVRRLAAGTDGILHLAALVSVQESILQPDLCLDINIRGTFNVLDAARQANVRRVVLASSASVYGDNPRLPLQEEAIPNPLSPYALSKYVGELYADMYHRLYRLETTALRYFNVYGPRQDPRSPYSGVISIFSDRILKGETIAIDGDGTQTRDFVHVDDVAGANLASLDRSCSGPRVYNVGSGQGTSINRLVQILMDIGGPVRIEHRPVRPGDIRHSCADIGRLHSELGYSPRCGLDAGLRDQLRTLGLRDRSAALPAE